MTIRLKLLAALSGFALFLVTGASFAAAPTHLQQAIAQTEQAIKAGKMVHPASLIQHADNAIDHAMQVPETIADARRIKVGVAHLRKAIKTAKGTWSRARVAAAVKHAQAALTNFQAAK